MPSMSEDALFKAILKNKPQQSTQSVQTVPKTQAAVKKEVVKPAPQILEVREIERQETKITHVSDPMQMNPVVESIKNLNSSVNMMYGLMKTVIVPVLILIVVVGVAILVRI